MIVSTVCGVGLFILACTWLSAWQVLHLADLKEGRVVLSASKVVSHKTPIAPASSDVRVDLGDVVGLERHIVEQTR